MIGIIFKSFKHIFKIIKKIRDSLLSLKPSEIYDSQNILYDEAKDVFDLQRPNEWYKSLNWFYSERGEYKTRYPGHSNAHDKSWHKAWLLVIQNDIMRGGSGTGLFNSYKSKLFLKDSEGHYSIPKKFAPSKKGSSSTGILESPIPLKGYDEGLDYYFDDFFESYCFQEFSFEFIPGIREDLELAIMFISFYLVAVRDSVARLDLGYKKHFISLTAERILEEVELFYYSSSATYNFLEE